MLTQFSRTELLFGKEAMEKLAHSRVAVFGIGGVGGYVCEALVRSGVGAFDLIDDDKVCLTNLNRQIIATRSTIGKYKTDVMMERMKDINPDVEVRVHKCFFLPENAGFLFDEQPDLILDAIDTVTAKLYLAEQCQQRGIPLVTCLGTGNRLDPSQLRWGDISETAGCGCPLARVMRRELKKRGVQKQTVVYSIEQPVKAICPGGEEKGRHSPASCAFVPPAAGYLLASVGYSLFIKRA